MKKILTIAALALMTSTMFVACSSDDTNDPQPTPTPAPTPAPTPTPTPTNPLVGTWNQVVDGITYNVGTLVMSNKPIIDYSAANTSVNPTIPEGTPTYTEEVYYVDPTTGIASNFVKQEGYYTLPEPVTTTSATGETTSAIPLTGKITFWPQVEMTSFDGSVWTATPKANMTTREEYDYQLIGNALIFTRGDKSTITFTLKSTPAATVVSTAFFQSWIQPNDLDPTMTTTLQMSAMPYIDYGTTTTPPNPSIPAGTPSYTLETKPVNALDPYTTGTWTQELGYFTYPAPTESTTTEGTTVSTIPSTGIITFWPQKIRTSTDGTNWTDTPAAEMPTTMKQYTYTLNGNVMILTGGDKSTLTYYTTILAQ